MYLSDSDKEDKDKKKDEEEKQHSDVSSESSDAKEAKAKEKWEKKLYKPTGPDGQGWGDFRQQTDQEKIILEELLKLEKAE